jgi:GNAT superfamily N-acetyltransferase
MAEKAIFLLPVHDKNVAMYRRILEVTLPVAYDDAWFKQTVSLWSDFARILYFKDIPVGVVGGRIETEGGVKRLYIMTLAVLAAYRGRGLGACTGGVRALWPSTLRAACGSPQTPPLTQARRSSPRSLARASPSTRT